MAWIESHQEVGRHPKTKRAARLLGVNIPQMVGHIHLLWWWALDFAEDGNLDSFEVSEIAEGAMWDGDPNAFIEALLTCGSKEKPGYLERTENGLVIHDWQEYAGKLIEQRHANAERQRRYRERRRDGDVTNTNEEHTALPNAHVTVTSPSRNGATGHDSTGHDLTTEITNVISVGAAAPSPQSIRERLSFYEARLNEAPNDNKKAVSIAGDALHECFGVETNYDHVAGMIRRYGAPFEIIKYCFAAVPNWNGTDDPHRYVNGILEDRKQRKEKANGHRASPNGRSVDRSVVNGTAEDMAATFLAKQAREEAERRQRESQNAPA